MKSWIGAAVFAILSTFLMAGTASAGAAGIVISEVLFDSTAATDSDGEFIELYNPESVSISLENWTINDGAATYTFPAGVSIAAGDYMVFAYDTAAFTTEYGFAPDGTYEQTFQLNNGGDKVELKLPNAQVADAMSYGSNTDVLDPSVPDTSGGGISLERIDPTTGATASASDWRQQATPSPGEAPAAGAVCGNFAVETPEVCDDGNVATETEVDCNTYGGCTTCNADCSAEVTLQGRFCGDATCDSGDGEDTVSCPADCTGSICGNGTQETGETCDDGDTETETACDYGTATCTLCNADCSAELTLTGATCGDASCDIVDGENSVACPADCGASTAPLILVSELVYDGANPSGTSDTDYEWIELYNPGSVAIDLVAEGYVLTDEEEFAGTEGAAIFPSGASIAAGAYYVVCNNAVAFAATYPTATCDAELVDSDATPDMTAEGVFAQNSIVLGNSGDQVAVLDSTYLIVDAVNWGNKTDYFDPSVPGVGAGESIARTPTSATDTDTAADWSLAATPTPGAAPAAAGPICGDGTVDTGETCDDGDTDTETECDYGTANCTLCNADCSAELTLTGRTCGDLTCDGADGEDNTTCATDCPPVAGVCGDGTVDTGETCDDGNTDTETECDYGTANCTLCNADCSAELTLTGRTCGDGTCDAGDGEDGTTCAVDCIVTNNSPLLITEVHYDADDSLAGDSVYEFIEIYNRSAVQVDISNYKVSDEEVQGGTEGCFQFPAGSFINPGEFLVICNTATSASTAFPGLLCDFEVNESNLTPNLIRYIPWGTSSNLSLSNTGDQVLLIDGTDTILDAMNYGNKTEFFDPSAPDVSAGSSLTRIDPAVDTDTAADWLAVETPTPGAAPIIPIVCGDGNALGSEVCDDGNTDDETEADCDVYGGCTTCNADCTAEISLDGRFCGDGTCDDADGEDETTCFDDCRPAVCGDTAVEDPEVCDDGNTASETEADCDVYGGCTTCNADCTAEITLQGRFCGDLTCDDADGEDNTSCPGDCPIIPVCGDTVTEGSEICDDGNEITETECAYGTATCTLCNADCTAELSLTGRTCGDLTCDTADGEDSGTCPGDCPVVPFCGDNNVDIDETCDDGNNADETEADCDVYGGCTACNADCSAEIELEGRFCGDGAVDSDGSEDCDDDNTDDDDGCSATCTIEDGWQCSGAPSTCTSVCGDNIIAGNEECDDGNTDDDDGCSATCTTEVAPGVCGDGTVDTDEDCDDGNTTDGDGCTADCADEAGWTCAGAPSMCAPICGDGIVVGTEGCDDANSFTLEGCSPTCTVETGWSCAGAPSVCDEVCGDGIIVGDEEYDDGNTANGDGSSADCEIEDGWFCLDLETLCLPICGDGMVVGTETCDGESSCNGACSHDDVTVNTTDSDGDGIPDSVETEIFGTDPNDADSDNDGASDSYELFAGTDPLDANDVPEGGASTGQPGDTGCSSTGTAPRNIGLAMMALLGLLAVRRRR